MSAAGTRVDRSASVSGWGGLVFASGDAAPPPFAEVLGAEFGSSATEPGVVLAALGVAEGPA